MAAISKAEKADKQRRRSAINSLRKAARDKAPTPLYVAGLARRREEEELLGARFVMEDQGVRIPCGEHAGRFGVIVVRGLLCEDDERGRLDARGEGLRGPRAPHAARRDKVDDGDGAAAAPAVPRDAAAALGAAA